MKKHNQYSFSIVYSGMEFNCEVNGTNLTVQSRGFFEERAWESLKKYLEAEGFITELDKQKGILDLFKF
jgi:hypothetical protein